MCNTVKDLFLCDHILACQRPKIYSQEFIIASILVLLGSRHGRCRSPIICCNTIPQKTLILHTEMEDHEEKTPVDLGVKRSRIKVILTCSSTLCCNVIIQIVLSLQILYIGGGQ